MHRDSGQLDFCCRGGGCVLSVPDRCDCFGGLDSLGRSISSLVSETFAASDSAVAWNRRDHRIALGSVLLGDQFRERVDRDGRRHDVTTLVRDRRPNDQAKAVSSAANRFRNGDVDRRMLRLSNQPIAV